MTWTAADIRNVVLLGLATVVAGLLVPVIPYAGLPLAAFALGTMAYRFGPIPAAALALLASLPVAVAGPALLGVSSLDAAFVLVALLAMGPGTAWALRRYGAWTVVGAVTLIVSGAFLAAPVGAQTLHDSLIVWRELFAAVAASGNATNAAAVRATATTLLAQMSVTWPGTAVYTMGIGVAIGVPLVSRAGRAFDQQVSRYPTLADVDLSFHLVWPAIAGLAISALAAYVEHGQGLLHAIGANVLMIVRPVLFLQGLAVFAGLYRRSGARRLTQGMGYVLLCITELLIPSVSVLGLADLFFNLRKRPRAQTDPVGPA